VTTDEFGQDLEHVEVLQRKFDEFQKDMSSQEYRVTEVNELAEKLVQDGHPEREVIHKRKEVSLSSRNSYLSSLSYYNVCQWIFNVRIHLCQSYVLIKNLKILVKVLGKTFSIQDRKMRTKN
jgi:hypothetical protein